MVKQNTLPKYENNEHDIPVDVLVNAARILNTTPWIYENKLDAIRQWRITLYFFANMKYNISKKVGENHEQYRKYY